MPHRPTAGIKLSGELTLMPWGQNPDFSMLLYGGNESPEYYRAKIKDALPLIRRVAHVMEKEQIRAALGRVTE